MVDVRQQQRGRFRNMINSLQQALRFLGQGTAGAFKPAEEELPEVGVQPYEGDPADKEKHEHHSW